VFVGFEKVVSMMKWPNSIAKNYNKKSLAGLSRKLT